MIILKLTKRDVLGKKVRKKEFHGLTPGIIYGAQIKNIPVFFNVKEFNQVFKEAGESSLIQLELNNKDRFIALIHSIQQHPLTDEITHVDFYVPNPKKEVKALVPLSFIGQAPAVKAGRILIKNIQEIEVKALPANLPHEIAVEISRLENVGDEVLVKDLVAPEGVELLREAEDVVASVVAPQKEEIVEEASSEEAEGPELVGKSEKTEEQEEGGPSKKTKK